MCCRLGVWVLVFAAALPASSAGQGVRDRIRSSPRGTTVTEDQAIDLTLTVTQVATREVQTWVRSAGRIDAAQKVITVYLTEPEASLVQVDQRARAFPVESRYSMNQARVTRVVPEGERTRVEISLLATGREGTRSYVVEIVTTRGDLLSVPNEAIIEEGDGQRIVYLQREGGRYEPQPIKVGVQGELYTQILEGVHEGDNVVTFGSFFIDSEYKLKGSAQGAP